MEVTPVQGIDHLEAHLDILPKALPAHASQSGANLPPPSIIASTTALNEPSLPDTSASVSYLNHSLCNGSAIQFLKDLYQSRLESGEDRGR